MSGGKVASLVGTRHDLSADLPPPASRPHPRPSCGCDYGDTAGCCGGVRSPACWENGDDETAHTALLDVRSPAFLNGGCSFAKLFGVFFVRGKFQLQLILPLQVRDWYNTQPKS